MIKFLLGYARNSNEFVSSRFAPNDFQSGWSEIQPGRQELYDCLIGLTIGRCGGDPDFYQTILSLNCIPA